MPPGLLEVYRRFLDAVDSVRGRPLRMMFGDPITEITSMLELNILIWNTRGAGSSIILTALLEPRGLGGDVQIWARGLQPALIGHFVVTRGFRTRLSITSPPTTPITARSWSVLRGPHPRNLSKGSSVFRLHGFSVTNSTPFWRIIGGRGCDLPDSLHHLSSRLK
ncbi:LOW QUALITY PROTEIN: hypothetical protein V2J09_018171 [Rumex salicifolius]